MVESELREEDRVFEEYKTVTARENSSEQEIAHLQYKLIGLLTIHANAVVWQMLRQNRPDVVNEALLRGFKGIRRFRGESKFSTWFQRIVINECKRTAVKEGKVARREVSLEDVEEIPAVDEPGVYISDEAILQKLPEGDKAFFICKEHGATDQELATAFGLSLIGVRVRWHRIKKRLKKLLLST